MTDIAALLSNAAQTNADFDLGKINKSYWEGRDQFAKNDLRDAFRNGVPTGPDGQPDFGAMAKVLFQKGGLSEGTAASNLGIQRDQLALGQQMAAQMGKAEGGVAQTGQPIVAPSINRNSVTADPSKRMDTGTQPASTPADQPTVMKVLAAQGIPNDQLEAASASIARQLGVNPTDPLDVNDPKVRNVLAPAVQQLKRMGVGQVAQTGQPQAQPIPQQDQGTFGAPQATPTRGLVPTGADPEIQRQIATYTAISSNPAFPKSVQEAAKSRLEALQKQVEPTGTMKEYELYRRQGGSLQFNEWMADTEARKTRATEGEKTTTTQKEYRQAQGQGYKGSLQDYIAETESRKTAATEEAKLGAKKYESLVENGTKAQMEIPQLELLQEQMNDPNFFSGVGEKYSLLYKRLKSAVGIDPEAAVPQEYLRKATAANVLSSLGALKGLGQIRVAEINMAREAAASPENSVPANRLLVEISKRTHQRNADIAEMAQNYKEANGTLDAGFDKKVTAFYKKSPLFTDAEIKDWHRIIGENKPTPQGRSGSFLGKTDQAAVEAEMRKRGLLK